MKHSNRKYTIQSSWALMTMLISMLIYSLMDATAMANTMGWLNSDIWSPKPVYLPDPHPKFVGVPILLLMFFSLIFYMWRDRPIVKNIIDYFYKGRMDRTAFVVSCAGLYFACTIIAFIYILTRTNLDPFMPVFSTLALAYEISLTVRRSHDIDLGWGATIFLLVLTLIPGISFLPFIYLVLRKGSTHENRYGLSPNEIHEKEIAVQQAEDAKNARRLAHGKMECLACHRVIDEDSLFCKYCGERQAEEHIG